MHVFRILEKQIGLRNKVRFVDFKNKKNNKNEPWFKWLTRELNSYEAFQDFESGKNPRDVERSRGLGDVYKRQLQILLCFLTLFVFQEF